MGVQQMALTTSASFSNALHVMAGVSDRGRQKVSTLEKEILFGVFCLAVSAMKLTPYQCIRSIGWSLNMLHRPLRLPLGGPMKLGFSLKICCIASLIVR